MKEECNVCPLEISGICPDFFNATRQPICDYMRKEEGVKIQEWKTPPALQRIVDQANSIISYFLIKGQEGGSGESGIT